MENSAAQLARRNSEESRERAPSPKSAAAAGAAMSIARCTMLRPAPAPIWYACTAVAAASSSVYRAYIAGFAEVATRSTSRNATQSNLDRDVLLRCLFARLAAAKHAARSTARTQICEISPGEQRLRGMSRATLRVQFLDASASHDSRLTARLNKQEPTLTIRRRRRAGARFRRSRRRTRLQPPSAPSAPPARSTDRERCRETTTHRGRQTA